MAAIELASAFVSIGGNTAPLAKDVDKALGGVEDAAAKSGGSSGSKFGSMFGSVLGKTAMAPVALAATGLGIAFTKGFSRLEAIDDAKAKLRGLGNTAEQVNGIMDSANKAVKGTAFGLDEAATAAATAVAAGIKPGQDLTKYLTLAGDAATIAGSSLSDMGSIFNKVQTNGKAMTDDLQMLADRGLPIFTWLQDEYKVSGEQLSKMVQSGQVDAATFRKVIQDHIGGAAQQGGKTFSGSMKNMTAALGRFGAAILSPVFNKGPQVFGAITTEVDRLTKAVGPVAGAIGNALTPLAHFGGDVIVATFKGLGDVLGGLATGVKNTFGFIADHQGVFGTIAAVIGGLLLPVLITTGVQLGIQGGLWLINTAAITAQTIAITAWSAATKIAGAAQAIFNAIMEANPIFLIITAITALVAGLVYFFTQTQIGQKIWESVWNGIKSVISAVWNGFLKPIFDAFSTAIGFVIDHWKLFALGFSIVLGPVGLVVAAFLLFRDQMMNVFTVIGNAVTWLWQNVFVAAWNGIGAAVSWVYTNILKPIWTGLQVDFNFIAGIVTWFWHNVIEAAWNGIGTAVSWVYNNVLKKIWDGLNADINFLAGVFNWFWHTIIEPVWNGLGNAIKWVIDNIISPAWEGMKAGLKSVGDFFGTIVQGISNAWDGVRKAVAVPINFVINTVWNNGLLKAWNAIAGWLPGLNKMTPLEPVKFMTGGATRGPVGKDTIPALLAGDEHIMDRGDVGALGGQRKVYALRHMLDLGIPFSWDAVNGLKRAPDGIADAIASAPVGGDMAGFLRAINVPGYLDGGAIMPMWQHQLMDGHAFAKSKNGDPYTWGFEDCSGYMSMIADKILGGPGQRRWATSSFPGGQPWLPGLAAGFSVGVHDDPGGPGGGHTAGTLTGVGPYATVNVESGGSHGNVAYGGPAAGADSSQWDGVRPGRFHLGIGADGAFISGGVGGGVSPDTQKNFLKDKIREIIDSFMNPVRRVMDTVVPKPPPEWYSVPGHALDATRDAAVNVASGAVGFLGDKLSSVYNGAKNAVGGVIHGAESIVGGITSVFRDTGGYIPNGLTLVRNETGKPEAVLNWDQLTQVRDLMKTGKSMMDAVHAVGATTDTKGADVTGTLGDNASLSEVDAYMYQKKMATVTATSTKEFMGNAGQIIGSSLFDIFSPTDKLPDLTALANRYTIVSDEQKKAQQDAQSKTSTTQQQTYGQTETQPVTTTYTQPQTMDENATNQEVKPDAVTPLPSGGGDASDYVGQIANAAKEANVGLQGAIIGVGTALTEVGNPLKMFANSNVPDSLNYPHDAVGSDGTSTGLFQQQQNGAWGGLDSTMNAFKSAGAFFGALTQFDWQSMDKGAAAQKVQASAYPDRYDANMGPAEELLKNKFDNGGIVPMGLSVVQNLTGSGEHMGILTNDQWSSLEMAAQGYQASGDDLSINISNLTVGNFREWERAKKNMEIRQSLKARGRTR